MPDAEEVRVADAPMTRLPAQIKDGLFDIATPEETPRGLSVPATRDVGREGPKHWGRKLKPTCNDWHKRKGRDDWH